MCSRLSVLLFIFSGFAAWNLIPLCPSLPVGAYRPSLAVGTADHCRHLIRHLTVTPSPTGEGNCKGLFRQQIFNAFIGESLIYWKAPLCKGSCQRSWLRDCISLNFCLFTIPPPRTCSAPPFAQGRLGWLYADNRFFMKLLTEEWVKLAFSCERRGTASAVDE